MALKRKFLSGCLILLTICLVPFSCSKDDGLEPIPDEVYLGDYVFFESPALSQCSDSVEFVDEVKSIEIVKAGLGKVSDQVFQIILGGLCMNKMVRSF